MAPFPHHTGLRQRKGWSGLVIVPVQTKQLTVSFTFSYLFVFLLWFVLKRRLLKCLKSKMGRNVEFGTQGATEVPTVAENTEKLNGTMTLNPSEWKYFLFPKTQNKFIYIMPLNLSLVKQERMILSLSLFCRQRNRDTKQWWSSMALKHAEYCCVPF